MRRLTFITANDYVVIGVNGIKSFMEAVGTNEFDSVQKIDEQFLAKIEKMQTHPTGFTPEHKWKFVTLIRGNIGKNCLISTHWFSTYKSPNAQYLMKAVESINQGNFIGASHKKIKINH